MVAAATDSGLLGKIFGFVAQPGLGPWGERKGDFHEVFWAQFVGIFFGEFAEFFF